MPSWFWWRLALVLGWIYLDATTAINWARPIFIVNALIWCYSIYLRNEKAKLEQERPDA